MINKPYRKFLLVSIFLNASLAHAQSPADSSKRLNLHFQQTIITQYKPAFSANYTGQNSMSPNHEVQTSLTTTVFLGARLWKGAELYVNPELAGGSGLSEAKGIAGFTNGEAFRIGSPEPKAYIARAYFSQIFKLKGEEEFVEDEANQLGGKIPTHYFSFTAGKFCIADFFDNNSYSHDPRRNFLNWSLMSNGAWDYPANTRGYTWGAVLNYQAKNYALRYAFTLVPKIANGPDMDFNFDKANASSLEFEKNYSIKSRKGCLRLLAYYNQANMGNYEAAVDSNVLQPDISLSRKYSRSKFGFGLNLEQELNDNLGFFARASWNDGKNETWAFTEIDHSVSAGLSHNGKLWGREKDCFGLAFVVNGISKEHQNYLKQGGYGFIIGDGKLFYGNEKILEAYYELLLNNKYFYVTPDYQFIINPAYNRARGSVHVFSLRVHVEI